MKKIKSRVWIYNRNNGDGSASPMFFTTEAAAEAYAQKDDERMCDDIFSHDFEFDEKGKLLNGSDDDD